LKRILHISTVHPSHDNRIHYKECRSLSTEDYDLKLLLQVEKDGMLDGLDHIKLGPFSGRLNRFVKGSWEVWSKVRKLKPALIHFHDPELMFVAVCIRLLGVKVVYDVHEDLPKQLLYKKWIPKIVRYPLSGLVRILEAFCSSFFQAIVVATEDIAQKFPESKTVVLRNFPLIDLELEPSKHLPREELNLIYAGGLTKVRGIAELIEALGQVKSEVRLTLIGKWSSEEYRLHCESFVGYSKVDYLGFMTMKEVYEHIANADVGIGTLKPIRNYLTSLPVKAFEYMLQGKPMILSNFDYWQHMFWGTAHFVDPNRPEEIAHAIDALASDPEKRRSMGEVGFAKVRDEYNWEVESQKLLDLYKRLLP